MNKILITSYCNINKPVNGRSRRMKALLETFQDDLILCEPEPEHRDFFTKAYKYDWGKKKRGINWGIFNFFNPLNNLAVKRIIRTEKPKFIIMTSIWDFYAIRQSSVPKILDAHNVDALAIEERFGKKHPFSKLVSRAEAAAIKAANHICCCSKDDKNEFINRYNVESGKISIVPNGVDLSEFTSINEDIPESWQEKMAGYKTLLFMGKLDYQPNEEALKFINNTLAPQLEKSQANCYKIIICGAPVPKNTDSYHKMIHFVGRVDQVVPWMKNADVCISPIFSGSGTRLKIIEYFSSGTPVVSTLKGAEGLGTTKNFDIVIADKMNFAEAVIALCSDPEKGKEIAEKAFLLAENKFDWKVIKPLWKEAIEKLR